MRTAYIFVATLAIAAAFTPSNWVSEEAPDTGLIEVVPHEGMFVQEKTFSEANDKLDMLMQVKKGNECINNAHKSIKSVIHEVQNAQGILNKMDNGSRCAGKGSSAVNNAKASLQRKQGAQKQAQSELNKAQNARVNVSVTFSSGNRNCNVFTSSAAWQHARRNKNRKQSALTKAKQQVKDAQNYLAKMQAQAIKDQCKCKDRVTKAAKSAVVQARKLTGERKRSIIRELMLICLVNARSKGNANARNSAGQRCKSQGLPGKYNSQLNLHQTKLVKMKFKCNRALQAGRFYCRFGYCYRTLGNARLNGNMQCDNKYMPVPKGCHIAPDNSHSHIISKQFSWGTSVLVFSNGQAWGSKTYSSSRFYGGARWLSTQNRSGKQWAKTNGCTLSVLLRCNKK